MTSLDAHRRYARQKMLTYAKAYDLQAIDIVNIRLKDLDQLQEECTVGAEVGFTGKQCARFSLSFTVPFQVVESRCRASDRTASLQLEG